MPLDNEGSKEGSREWQALSLACLAAVLILQTVMLASLFTQSLPHPPLELAPLFGAILALGGFTVVLLLFRWRSGYIAAGASALLAMISYGPHKLFLGEDPAILPAVVAGFLFALGLLYAAVKGWLATRPETKG